METQNCYNCGAEIRNTLLKNNDPSSSGRTKAINDILGKDKQGYCGKCVPDLLKELTILKDELNKYINRNIKLVPVITTHTPFGWNYKALGIVTGQSVTGTGVISEFASGFTDFFGQQSNTFIRKIASGEDMCLSQLRLKALKMGGHAIIATDIDYGELGSIKGMIMVCAAGTAVQLADLNVLGDNQEVIAELQQKSRILDKFLIHRDSIGV